jgi:hypothetical protein
MSDQPKNETADEAEYQESFRPVKRIARVVFGAMALWGVAAIAVGLCVVAWGLWKDISHSVATTDWSWWTWPRVLLALSVPLGIAILVLNRIRIRRGPLRSLNARANRPKP